MVRPGAGDTTKSDDGTWAGLRAPEEGEAVAREAAEFPELCRKFTYPGFVRTFREECPRILLSLEIAQTATTQEANRAPLPKRIELAVRRRMDLIAERLLSSPVVAGGVLSRKG